MNRSQRAMRLRHTEVIAEVMRDEGLSLNDVITRSLVNGKPVHLNTLRRVMDGCYPGNRVQSAIAAALSTPETGHVISAAEIFGDRPLPAWARNAVYGTAVAA